MTLKTNDKRHKYGYFIWELGVNLCLTDNIVDLSLRKLHICTKKFII